MISFSDSSRFTNTPPPQPPSDKTDNSPEPTHSLLTPKPTYPFTPPQRIIPNKRTDRQTRSYVIGKLGGWGGELPPGIPSGGTQVL
ncbi:hypothetical protein TNCT_641171 [Trichonephila clavata]|uniref:Uncharacterized protein n=1 Tax=Trichonephila clavata TaxID=2740835 RepID=A0A8X6IJF4_TRICU|nr:hypothetical protein TNCT_641171 [Trichonephila clavata]